jgi:hypothetical protein
VRLILKEKLNEHYNLEPSTNKSFEQISEENQETTRVELDIENDQEIMVETEQGEKNLLTLKNKQVKVTKKSFL